LEAANKEIETLRNELNALKVQSQNTEAQLKQQLEVFFPFFFKGSQQYFFSFLLRELKQNINQKGID
jgi:hypothetical protein